MIQTLTRYSDTELAEFKAIIEGKLEKANEQIRSLREQILDISENSGDGFGGDWMDDSSSNSEKEMLHTMANRQKIYIRDLENALARIRNKTYGVCIITGELIDKKRLIAVPTTTKSLHAKNEEQKAKEEKSNGMPPKLSYVKKEQASPKIISKVIKKASITASNKGIKVEDEDDLDDEEDLYMEDDNDIDFDQLASTDSDED